MNDQILDVLRIIYQTDWFPLLALVIIFVFLRYVLVRTRSLQSNSLDIMKANAEILKETNRLMKEQIEALKEIAAAVAKLKS